MPSRQLQPDNPRQGISVRYARETLTIDASSAEIKTRTLTYAEIEEHRRELVRRLEGNDAA